MLKEEQEEQQNEWEVMLKDDIKEKQLQMLGEKQQEECR